MRKIDKKLGQLISFNRKNFSQWTISSIHKYYQLKYGTNVVVVTCEWYLAG